MDMATYLRSIDAAERQRIASKAGTSVAHLYQIAGGHRAAGPKMAIAIERATDGMVTRAELRPDLWEATAIPLSTPPPPNRRQVPDRRTSERRQASTRRTEEATPGRRIGGERRQGERRAAKAAEDPPKPKPALSSDEACPEPRRRGEADRAA